MIKAKKARKQVLQKTKSEKSKTNIQTGMNGKLKTYEEKANCLNTSLASVFNTDNSGTSPHTDIGKNCQLEKTEVL